LAGRSLAPGSETAHLFSPSIIPFGKIIIPTLPPALDVTLSGGTRLGGFARKSAETTAAAAASLQQHFVIDARENFACPRSTSL
jgi:hypothetical protein